MRLQNGSPQTNQRHPCRPATCYIHSLLSCVPYLDLLIDGSPHQSGVILITLRSLYSFTASSSYIHIQTHTNTYTYITHALTQALQNALSLDFWPMCDAWSVGYCCRKEELGFSHLLALLYYLHMLIITKQKKKKAV